MRVLISGSSGLAGTAVSKLLVENGHSVARLLRRRSRPAGGFVETDVRWDPVENEFAAEAAEGADAVIHLAGASIAEGRWTEARKTLLRTSRVDATRHLVGALASLTHKPKIFVSASAIGYFGNRGDEKLNDYSGPGGDFLALLCRDWEREAQRAAEFGARVAILRFGIVLDARDGALPRMLLPIRLFVGGKLGTGLQWMSWVSLDDVANAVKFALENDAARGPMNVVSPNPVRNEDFIHTAARILHRPAVFPAPAFALRAALGEMADALLFTSQRVVPEKLPALGFTFQDAQLEPALRRILAK
jgi:uncharacterized protein